jgi:hypothetical protein
MSDEVARVTKVRLAGGRVLRVRFAGDRRDYKLDMTGLIARSAHFAPLMDDAQSFAKVAGAGAMTGADFAEDQPAGRVSAPDVEGGPLFHAASVTPRRY